MTLGERERVLVAVDGLTIDRVLATPGRIAGASRPALSTLDVLVSANALAGEGYLTVEDDGQGTLHYVPTATGREWVAAIYARGTR